MKREKGNVIRAALLLSLALLAGCSELNAPPTPFPIPATAVSSPTTPSPTPPRPDTGWTTLQPGLERRLINLSGAVVLDDQPRETLYLLRLDPAAFRFDIGYSPGQPRSLAEWAADTGALLVVNGGYFTEAYVATGLIVADGAASGVSYGDFAGMLAITGSGPEVRWLAERPYDPAESLLAGLQSFPMLVKPGGQIGFAEEDGSRARRTVIGQDKDGRLLVILTRGDSFSLHGLSRYLIASDLELDVALNLDGGASSGLVLAQPPEALPALSPLPTVILVYPR